MSKIVKAMPLAIFNATGLTSTLKPIASSGFGGQAMLIIFQNDSDKDVGISYDGTTVHETVLSQDKLEINLFGTAVGDEYRGLFRKGTRVHISSLSAGTGYIYMSVYYQN